MGRFLNSLHERTEVVDRTDYHREQYQSFMTGPEWRNVEMAVEYAEFVAAGKSIFQFPYFRQTYDLWAVTFNSFKAARKHNGFFEILTSEYMMMDLFVSLFTTLELLPKAVLSLFLFPFLKNENHTEMQKHLSDFYKKYAEDIHTIPFYDHDYKTLREELAAKYAKCEKISLVDWFSWTCVSLELRARQWISRPFSYWFHQGDTSTPDKTDILVKYRAKEGENVAEAQKLFRDSLSQLIDSKLPLSIVNDEVYAKKPSESKSYITVFARLRVSRYMDFKPVMLALDEKQIHIRKIAGQDRIQVKCDIKAQDESTLEQSQLRVNEKSCQLPQYTYIDRIDPYRRVSMFDFHVRELADRVKDLDRERNSKVTFIHNF